jgi:hypothetical protein
MRNSVFFFLFLYFSCSVNYPNTNIKERPKLTIFGSGFINANDDYLVYYCSSYQWEYIFKERPLRKKSKEVCVCRLVHKNKINIEIEFDTIGRLTCINNILIYDTNFIIKYLLPLLEDKEAKEAMEYTLLNANDSIFLNIIDFNNKIILNEIAYYYPIKTKKMIQVFVDDIEWFKSVVPETKWIYQPDCHTMELKSDINILIPLLEEEQ